MCPPSFSGRKRYWEQVTSRKQADRNPAGMVARGTLARFYTLAVERACERNSETRLQEKA
jgi:hypothetical protein